MCCVSTAPYSPVYTVDRESRTSTGRRRRERFDLEHAEPADDVDRHKPTLEETLGDIRVYLRHLAAAAGTDGGDDVRQGSGPSHRDLVIGEWQRVALVVDRVSFALFALISVVVTIALYN